MLCAGGRIAFICFNISFALSMDIPQKFGTRCEHEPCTVNPHSNAI